MSIQALPFETVRLLGASSMIITPYAIVKELLENAIDAGASSVEVLLSPNTVEKVQVRDNGQGIDVDDFDAIGRRAHTSKLTCFDELAVKGGQTFGFRGEALAAINTVAGAVYITTRTAQDPVASRMRLKTGSGGTENQRPASAPVGTTVQVDGLFENVPVQKQQAVKDRRKGVSSIKKLLQSYALAKPSIRLSLKVIGEPTYDLQYSPSSPPTVRDAIAQLFGASVSSYCVYRRETIEIDHVLPLPRGTEDLPIVMMEATFLDPNVSLSITGTPSAAYISIDGRPIDSQKGIAKKIYAAFKTGLASHSASAGQPKHSFLRLNIQCPPGSYDVNVTSLKDEVLFSDDEVLLSCFQNLWQRWPNTEDKCSFESTDEDTPPTPGTNSNCQEFRLETDDQSRLPNSNSLDSMMRAPSNVRDDSAQPKDAMSRMLATNSPQMTTGTDRLNIRTLVRVNMERHKSDMSDEDSLANLGSFEPYAQLLVANKFTSKPPNFDSKSTKKSIARALGGSEDMHRYLVPRANSDFEIATDSTATEGHPTKPRSATGSRQSGLGKARLPLEPVPDSVLNSMHGESSEVEELEDHNSNLNQESPHQLQRHNGDLHAHFRRQAPPTPMERHQREGRSDILLNVASSSVNSGEVLGHSQSMPSSLTPPRRLSFQTPPPTIGRAPHVGSHRPFLPPSMRRSPAQRARLTHNVPANSIPRAQRVSLRPLRHPDLTQQRSAGVHSARQSQDRDVERTSYSVANQRAHLVARQEDVQREHWTPGLVSEYLEEPLPGPSGQMEPSNTIDLTGPQVSNDTAPLSHRSQVLLMETPPPMHGEVVANHNATAEGSPPSESSDKSVTTKKKPDMSDPTHHAFGSSAGGRQSIGPNPDPRAYLIARKRSEAQRGRPRRLSTRHLPLERTIYSARTHNVRAIIRCHGKDEHIECSGYGPDWVSLDFTDLTDVDRLTHRLKGVVDRWISRLDLEVEVEYTLRSNVKGKQAV